jgi:hypothetical protein
MSGKTPKDDLTTKVDATKFLKQNAALAKGTFTLTRVDIFLFGKLR